mmetsp:Transcript_125178/g.297027  ORF Transcript_125178/g.297027 Transcript_125178/m.297027 type:complete len:245 (-) Transcript_125178:1090-1824(-)
MRGRTAWSAAFAVKSKIAQVNASEHVAGACTCFWRLSTDAAFSSSNVSRCRHDLPYSGLRVAAMLSPTQHQRTQWCKAQHCPWHICNTLHANAECVGYNGGFAHAAFFCNEAWRFSTGSVPDEFGVQPGTNVLLAAHGHIIRSSRPEARHASGNICASLVQWLHEPRAFNDATDACTDGGRNGFKYWACGDGVHHGFLALRGRFESCSGIAASHDKCWSTCWATCGPQLRQAVIPFLMPWSDGD